MSDELMEPNDYLAKEERRNELRQAAIALLRAGEGRYRHQPDGIVLRDVDPYDENPRVLHILPTGPVVGFAICRQGDPIPDKEIVFVAISAVASAVSSIGFVAVPGVSLHPSESLVEQQTSAPDD